jgi:prepilin-type N-terminal cleavage/methylation domain-containing protein
MSDKNKRGFSLVEVMVVISTVSVVMAVTMPAMTAARSRARAIVCRSNLRQLVLANTGYSADHDGYYVSAARDFLADNDPFGGLQRWHGVRENINVLFDPKKGPLAGYLAGGKVKECPEKVDFTKDQGWAINFERGCGGYGYNMQYIGSRLWQSSITTKSAWKKAYSASANAMEVKRPAETLMFTDAAFLQNNQYLIEYSFSETPYYVVEGKPDPSGRKLGFPSPSIHFRHYGLTNIGCADGHIEAKPMAKPTLRDGYTAEMAKMNIGWFAPVDNTLFDLE